MEIEQVISTLQRYWYTIIVVFVIARFLYYPHNGKREFLFAYILLSAIIAMLCVLISRVEISLGFALGIFAIFNIISFRAATVSPREMTYLFICSGVAAKNILAPEEMSFYRLLVSDFTVMIIIVIAEYALFRNNRSTKTIIYQNLELIHPNKWNELESDLNQKYGISGIQDIKVGEINEAKKFTKLTVDFNATGRIN
jgi:hypothetical protein